MLEPEELTYEEALTMAMLLGFEWQECEWCAGDSAHFCFQCIYTHWGCCGKLDREDAVWTFLVLKGVVTRAPGNLQLDLWRTEYGDDTLV